MEDLSRFTISVNTNQRRQFIPGTFSLVAKEALPKLLPCQGFEPKTSWLGVRCVIHYSTEVLLRETHSKHDTDGKQKKKKKIHSLIIIQWTLHIISVTWKINFQENMLKISHIQACNHKNFGHTILNTLHNINYKMQISTNHPVNQPTTQPSSHLPNQHTSQATKQPISQPIKQASNQPTNQPANHPTAPVRGIESYENHTYAGIHFV